MTCVHLTLLRSACLFLFILQISGVYGQRVSGSATLNLDDNWEERIFSISQLEFFEDSTNSLTFDEVIQPGFQQLIKIRPSFSKNNFNTAFTYWVKLSIKNFPKSKKKWLIEFYDQSIDHIEAYIPDKEGNYIQKTMGDARPFRDREFFHKNFQVNIDNEGEGISNFYFKINSSQKADIRIAVRSFNRFVYYALNEYFLYGLFYGMIIIIAFYNFLIFLAVREMKYIYYIFYLLSVGLYAMSLDGVGYQYLWPNNPEFNLLVNGIFSFSIVIWAILFSLRFLNTRDKSPVFHYLLLASLGIKSLFFINGLFFDVKYFDISYFDVIPFLLIFISSIYILAKGYKVARFFVMAYGVLFVGAVIKVMANTALIEHSTLVYYSLHLAFLIEMVLLSFALGDRIRIMKEIRDRALKRSLQQYKVNVALKEKVNKELESKVKERTRELEDKNRLLIQYNEQLQEKDEEIKRINSLLDKDNWKLKSSIRESFQARLINKLLSYEEFKKIFPDKSACCRHLEQFKWERGFECRQCGNSKCSHGPKLFSRRCTKCGYIDSVTAGTIFHGVRFPLEKAFYIAYSVISDTKPQTLDQLAGMLDLRKNTVWAFRKKVKKAIDQNGMERPHWQDILMEEDMVKIR
ncbi:7TM diverse intracellular signaling domain-containing protein [Negadavirga shengliensis]|uniref:7TM diverse intracellular signaling domain-containing protein n=1 Tax=Negadavirga shengliensis TaxID=1389218 RepID=A0ABV9SXD1_9BACT